MKRRSFFAAVAAALAAPFVVKAKPAEYKWQCESPNPALWRPVIGKVDYKAFRCVSVIPVLSDDGKRVIANRFEFRAGAG